MLRKADVTVVGVLRSITGLVLAPLPGSGTLVLAAGRQAGHRA